MGNPAEETPPESNLLGMHLVPLAKDPDPACEGKKSGQKMKFILLPAIFLSFLEALALPDGTMAQSRLGNELHSPNHFQSFRSRASRRC